MVKPKVWTAKSFWVSVVAVFFQLIILAEPASAGSLWSYTLVDGSRLVDDCPICDRIPIVRPMRGTFQLRLRQQNPLFAEYDVENVAFIAGDTNDFSYKVLGSGTYRIGGEVAVLQDMFLKVTIDNGFTNYVVYLTNTTRGAMRRWPMIQCGLDQTNGTATQQFHFDLATAPFRELWFSTVHSFKASTWQPPTNVISAGDLVSSVGRVVKRNHDLTQFLGIMPPVPDLGLKAMDILPGGEIGFSIETAQFSETLRTQLLPGDVLSNQGRILRRNKELIAAFVPKPPLPDDVGLEALQVMNDGDIHFAVRAGFYSEKLGRSIERGDLLSSRGTVIKANADLVALFRPAKPGNNVGLKVAYTWPNGEIWFATEDGFYNSESNYFAAGDLLSDQSYVVLRNQELVSAFEASAGLSPVGLDALFVVSDAVPAPSGADKTRLSPPIATNQPVGSLAIKWNGASRVSQLERAPDATGPFSPVNVISTDMTFIDASVRLNESKTFYRLHQW
jgi:hypothetical protein